jgi:hypothetical protein
MMLRRLPQWDYDLSQREIAAAGTALLQLDVRDGKLSPEECGLVLGEQARARLGTDVVGRARLDFMHGNPVLAAIDIDKSGELSEGERKQVASGLKMLDKNGDGNLTPDEIIPDLVRKHASIILSRIDNNGDDAISLSERMEAEADPLRTVVESADLNRDGFITRKELEDRLQLSLEVKSRLDHALRAIP